MSYLPRRRRLRPLVVTSVALVGLTTFGCAGSDEPASPAVTASSVDAGALLSAADFGSFIDEHPEVPLINVHVPYEGHIDGTDAFIAFDSILESNELPSDRSAPIALYCRSGNMSAQATADLAQAGYTNVVDLEGGMNAWTANGGALLDDPMIVDG